MDTVTYPQENVADFVNHHFVAVKIQIDDHPDLTEKYRVPWTPTLIVLGPDGTEHFRDIGYLPPEDFLAHMHLALGRAAFETRNFAVATELFQTAVDKHPESPVVPEALYLLGVSKNRMNGGTSNDRRAIWKKLVEEHPKTDWAKKASFAFE